MKTRGFTLIELLFVIAVLAFFSTTGILFYQQYMQTQKIQKTVSQIDQWLQAGMAFYIQNRHWPSKAQELIDAGYMPANTIAHNPWCNSGECYKVVNPTPKGQLFTITATINASQTIRDTIAARLPYGKPDGTGVAATVNVPLAGINNYPDVIIKSIIPYTLAGEKDFVFLQSSNEPERFTGNQFVIYDKPIEGNIPSCAAQYGENYHFVSYASVTEMRSTTQNGTEVQPAVISNFQLRTNLKDGKVVLFGWVRPQEYWAREPVVATVMISEVYKELGPSLEMKGFVFFLCCKKGISCTPMN